jgi:hypothetical protein
MKTLDCFRYGLTTTLFGAEKKRRDSPSPRN